MFTSKKIKFVIKRKTNLKKLVTFQVYKLEEDKSKLFLLYFK